MVLLLASVLKLPGPSPMRGRDEADPPDAPDARSPRPATPLVLFSAYVGGLGADDMVAAVSVAAPLAVVRRIVGVAELSGCRDVVLLSVGDVLSVVVGGTVLIRCN